MGFLRGHRIKADALDSALKLVIIRLIIKKS